MKSNMKVGISTTIALVGLMGAGKSAIGRRLASRLEVPFFDSDAEVESEASMSISEIFVNEGEEAFRCRERSTIKHLLSGPAHILATGGGSFVEPETRRELAERALTVWLKADLEVLYKRILRKDNRPLLKKRSPRRALANLIKQRYPLYALADITVESGSGPHEQVVDVIISELNISRVLGHDVRPQHQRKVEL
jgi:shikimate kinase